MFQRIRELRRDQRGVSLIELLVVVMLFSLISGAVTTAVILTQRQTNITELRQRGVDQARLGIDALTKTLRTAVQPAQLQATCTTCTSSVFTSSAVTAGTSNSVKFFGNLNNSGGGPSIVTFTTTLDATTNTGTLTETIQGADAGSAPNYTYCTPGPTCPVFTRKLVKGLVWPANLFTFYDNTGATLTPGQTGLTTSQLSLVDSMDLTLVVRMNNTYQSKTSSTLTARVQLPNADTSVQPSPTASP